MVVRINSSKNILRALNYNEQKLKKGDAICLYAHHFLKDATALNFHDKLRCFRQFQELNERTKTNTLHVSLNFHPTENYPAEKLCDIARNYMEGIGFGAQPYLVYQHFDSGHPHLHIVSTNIQWDGSRISLHNLGRHLSEQVRKQIEIDFRLVKAGRRTIPDDLSAVGKSLKIVYGKEETKKQMARVLQHVLPTYLYTSLPELNAVLKDYNLVADRGEKDSKTFTTGGLVYRVLDNKGEKTGTPVKASSFSFKPTLSFLEKQFRKNEVLRSPHAQRLKTKIDFLLSKKRDRSSFQKSLEKEGINILWRGSDNQIYGITYIDHVTRSVFNGSDLGKEYSAKKILERCTPPIQRVDKKSISDHDAISLPGTTTESGAPELTLLQEIIQPENTYAFLPYGFKKKKKRKTKKL